LYAIICSRYYRIKNNKGVTQGCSSGPDLYDTRARKRLKLKKEKKNKKNYDRRVTLTTQRKKLQNV
jgi:hypothetical protein